MLKAASTTKEVGEGVEDQVVMDLEFREEHAHDL